MIDFDNKSLEHLFEVLGTIVKPECIYTWLTTPVPFLDNRKPISVIDAGETEKIWEMIYAVISGISS